MKQNAAAADMMVDNTRPEDESRQAMEAEAVARRHAGRVRDLQGTLAQLLSQPMLPKGAARNFISATDLSGLTIDMRLAILNGSTAVTSARQDFAASAAKTAAAASHGHAGVGHKLLGKKRKAE